VPTTKSTPFVVSKDDWDTNEGPGKSMKNAFLNKRDLLLPQIMGNTCPDIIMICEILPKSPSAIINLSLIVIPCHYTT